MRGVKSGRGIGIARQIVGAARVVPTSTKFACHVHHDVCHAHARGGVGFSGAMERGGMVLSQQ